MFLEDGSYPCIEPGDDFLECAEIIAAEREEEFAFFPYIDADAVEAAALARFMPMGLTLEVGGGSRDLFLPKLHMERCLLDPRGVRVTRTARRESKAYSISFNRAFHRVLASCASAHGTEWLVPDLVGAFATLHEQRAIRRVAFVSTELWRVDESREDLVAGEIGYLIGSSYASLTGYTTVSGAGTVQLAALGCMLAACGIRVWDLGMDMEYKRRLGGRALRRGRFMPILARAYADTSASAGLHFLSESLLIPARESIDAPRS
ncbi:MAG: hypothetical protein KKA67_03640 [Spirochaetes bacterium]|nr:hypothetical protein [Spirochaetota bacterium]MBU1079394.1 hypothetical protein [Spirochaetota bacterium]